MITQPHETPWQHEAWQITAVDENNRPTEITFYRSYNSQTKAFSDPVGKHDIVMDTDTEGNLYVKSMARIDLKKDGSKYI